MHQPDPRDDRDQEADDRAWRSIVENYGERVELEEPGPRPEAGPATDVPPDVPPDVPFAGRFGDPQSLGHAEGDDPFTGRFAEVDDEEEGYEPPPPPPLPKLAPDRLIAWAGVFGSPLVLLLSMLVSVSLPTWLGYLLIVGFVGGFVYLVAKMPREPRDPWDDGAQV